MNEFNATSDFVNRTNEVKLLNAFLLQRQVSPGMEVWSAPAHSGLTHFLRYCSDNNANSSIALYADAAKHDVNSLFGQFGLEFYKKYPQVWRHYIDFQEQRAGRSRTREMAAAITASIPYVGRALARGVELQYPTLSYSAYPSIAAEVFCEFLIELSTQQQVFMLLDNVQELDTSSAELLSVTVGRAYKNIRYVAGLVTHREGKATSAEEFTLRSRGIGYKVEIRHFPKPDVEFIKLYAVANGVQWPQNLCEAIAAATAGDIYKIRAAVAAAGGNVADLNSLLAGVHPAASKILRLLVIAQQDIRRSDVITLCMDDEAIFLESEYEIEAVLDNLTTNGLIGLTPLPDGDQLIALRPSRHTVKDVLGSSLTDIIRDETTLYDYFSRAQRISGRHSPAEVAPLLFRLAKRVAVEDIDIRLRDIIRLSLQMGSRSLAEEFVDRAIAPEKQSLPTIQDYLAKLAFLISIKAFGRVLELTNRPPDEHWEDNRFVRLFRGIALNRRRHHDESEKLLAQLCEGVSSPEELAVIVSYRIVGRIHANDLMAAQQLFFDFRDKLVDASNYGYFLRNGAEVFETEEGIKVLTSALAYHERNQDTFGIATTRCNRGAKLAQIGQAEIGLKDVEHAYDLLEIFGIHHLGMVIGDLAHCYLYLGLYTQAEATCNKALRYMGKELPRAYTLTNLAAALLLNDKKEEAMAKINEVSAEAETAKVDRVRQKVYLNGAIISLFAGAPLDLISSYCEKALAHPDRRNRQITVEKVGVIRELLVNPEELSSELFFKLYSPCSMFYWYQNPLEGLPIDVLSTETVIENPSQQLPM